MRMNRADWKSRITRAAVTAVVCGVGLAAVAETVEIKVSPQTSRKIRIPAGVEEIFINNPGVIDAKPSSDGYSVLVTGIKQGSAELTISRLRQSDIVYRVEVEPELKDLAGEVKKMLREVEGVIVQVMKDKIILDGELLTKSGADRVKEVTDAFQGTVINLTKVDLDLWRRNVKRALEKEIGVASVEVEMIGDRIMIMGSVPSVAELERVKDIIATKRLDNVTIMLQIRR